MQHYVVEPTPRSRHGGLLVLVAAWALAVVGGQAWLWSYQLTPGDTAGVAPQEWPVDAGVPSHPGRPLLLMIAHPQCSCTRASLAELARVVSRFGGLRVQPTLYLSVVVPGAGDDLSAAGPVLRSAAGIPGLRVRLDRGGALAKRLGATTSGHVLVYDAAGRLAFSGGITAARGHEGGSTGADAILAAAHGRDPSARESLVFGCHLRDRPPGGHSSSLPAATGANP